MDRNSSSRIIQKLTALLFNTSARNRPNLSVFGSSTSDIQEVDTMARTRTATRSSRILVIVLTAMTAAALGCGNESTEPRPPETPVVPPPIVINEVNPDGDLTGGWVEVFNSTPDAIDLAGWFIVTVIGPSHVEVYTFPTGSVIGAGEFVVVDEVMIPGLLNANGTVALFSKNAVQSDALSWVANAPGVAFARCPDGDRSGSLVRTTTPTRKAPNVCGT
jgi:hypothetical protein